MQSTKLTPMLQRLSPYVYLPGAAMLFIRVCLESVLFIAIQFFVYFKCLLRLIMERDESSSESFPMGETAQEKAFSHVPECYTISTSQRPGLNPETGIVPVVDWAALSSPDRRSDAINEIKNACSRSGCFQVSQKP